MPASTGKPRPNPPHRRSRRRVRPHRPYQAGLGFRRWASRLHVWAREDQVRLHGSRVHELMSALAIRQPQVQSGIVYVSADQLAEMTGKDERTMRRAIADLVELGELGPVEIVRPNLCEGERCGYVKRACPGWHGGKMLDEDGRPMGAANGFAIRPTWVARVRRLSTAPTRAPGQPTRATLAEEREAALRALERRQAAQDASPPPPEPSRPAEGGQGPLADALGAVMGRLPARGRDP